MRQWEFEVVDKTFFVGFDGSLRTASTWSTLRPMLQDGVAGSNVQGTQPVKKNRAERRAAAKMKKKLAAAPIREAHEGRVTADLDAAERGATSLEDLSEAEREAFLDEQMERGEAVGVEPGGDGGFE